MFPTGLFLAQLTRSATSVLLCLAGRQLHWLHALGLQNDIVLSATTAAPAEIRQKFTIVSLAKWLNPECLPERHKRLLTASYIIKQVKILSIFQGFSATLLGKECFITWIFLYTKFHKWYISLHTRCSFLSLRLRSCTLTNTAAGATFQRVPMNSPQRPHKSSESEGEKLLLLHPPVPFLNCVFTRLIQK